MDRFSLVLQALCAVVAARSAGNALPTALIRLIWNHLRRIERRVLALVAAIQSGRLRVGHGHGGRPGMRRAASAQGLVFPRGYAWLCRLVPYKAAALSGQLRVALEDPEMVALIAATPRMAKLLRPLCRMLGMDTGFLTPVAVVTDFVTIDDDGDVRARVGFCGGAVALPVAVVTGVPAEVHADFGFFKPA